MESMEDFDGEMWACLMYLHHLGALIMYGITF
jgi:hypothetical protein